MSQEKGKSQLELEAWDRYAAAAIAGISSRGPADAIDVAGEAAHYANAMLEERRVLWPKLLRQNES
ncbi:hypothetical protein [Pseudomonas abietaniphila]|jgi:hypothetical protein|uniref:Uncharacterized protein n=1 Tax=Pseudomonas abietaniphila TaxID=89065 RepID=A0A1G8TAA2_9PSED|nr:hypothetical protein [Pseudomonas abietaniphila]SDJ38411.1 hypothetical protein SAMN05216605_12816 [Pseudomonas abietaniphila]